MNSQEVVAEKCPSVSSHRDDRFDNGTDLFFVPPIVRIQEADDFTFARSKSSVECRCLSSILLQDSLDISSIAGKNVAGVVRRSIIDNDHLDIVIPLAKCAINRGGQELSVVVVVD
jgi:hypothetical protein